MKTVIKMAREAGFKEHNDMIYVTTINDDCAKELERFTELVRADEREACAKVCDDFEYAKWESVKNISQNGGRLVFANPTQCAAAIRDRNNA